MATFLEEDNVVFTSPFDPANRSSQALAMHNGDVNVVGGRTLASLFPGEVQQHYNTFDCQKRLLRCTVGDDYVCLACTSLGGGECIRASDDIKNAQGWALDDESIGVCVSHNFGLDDAMAMARINPYTTVDEA